jgi:hypothetical protein
VLRGHNPGNSQLGILALHRHCGAHTGNLLAVAESQEGPSVRHPALHLLTRDYCQIVADNLSKPGRVGLYREHGAYSSVRRTPTALL